MRILRHILVFSILILASLVLRRSIPPEPSLTQINAGAQVQGENTSKGEYLDVEVNGDVYRARWIKVENLESLSLISNYDKFMTSADLIENNECRMVTSAGFYDTENKPLGLVVSDGVIVKEFRRNSLLNGILSINDFGTPRITREIPSGMTKNAIQSGPTLWENGSEMNLKLNSDKNARRVFSVINGSNELYFFVVYDPDSTYNGPLLAELPQIIDSINESLNLNVADAINLDGGSASVFKSKEVSLTELSPVGSFWCIK